MARKWETQTTNWQAPTTAFPDGNLRDDSFLNANDGTVINEVLHGDIMQFFLKLLRDAAITPNQLTDNENDGYQLMDALESKFAEFRGYTVLSGITPATNVTINFSKILKFYNYIILSATYKRSAGASAGALIFTLPNTMDTFAERIEFSASSSDTQNQSGQTYYAEAGTREIRLLQSGDDQIFYSFSVTIPINV